MPALAGMTGWLNFPALKEHKFFGSFFQKRTASMTSEKAGGARPGEDIAPPGAL
jgi:hypothetical protein